MTQRTCGNCRWWNRHSGLATGDCQKLPPNSVTGQWPATDEADFCGQWADKNITPEQAERRELVRRFALAIVSTEYPRNQAVAAIWKFASDLADAEPKIQREDGK
jgi:hypothetical protein